jgi:hypothetical protein
MARIDGAVAIPGASLSVDPSQPDPRSERMQGTSWPQGAPGPIDERFALLHAIQDVYP